MSYQRLTGQQEKPLLQGVHREDSVIAVFGTLDHAERAVHLLYQDGFPLRQISLVSSAFYSEREVQGYVTTGDVVGSGDWVGGVFGLLMGSAFLWLPVFGPLVVVGPLASMLVGAAGGGTAGSALGALMNLGVSRQHILEYEEQVRAGGFLLIAHGHASEVECARVALERGGVGELTVHSGGFA